MKNNPARTLLIWDSEDTPPAGSWNTVLWSGFSKTKDDRVVSIPAMVEEQADALRKRYLAWIYELGESIIDGKRMVDHLELRPGFSYWWMTSLAQKFNASGSSEIDNAIKAFVLENLVLEKKPESLIVVTDNVKLAEVFRRFCRKASLTFTWNASKRTKKPRPLVRRFFAVFPYLLQSFIYLIWYTVKGFPLLFKRQSKKVSLDAEICFVDVLVHLDKQTFKTERFISNYWTTLVDKLALLNIKTNWLHNYFQHEPLSSLARAQALMGRFNCDPNGNANHALLEESLSPSVLFTTLRDFLRINTASFRLSLFSRCFQPAGSTLDLWPLFKDEWMDSVRGREGMRNCLRLSLNETAMKSMSRQRIGVYIQENQPWELSLISAWKAAGHGTLIGTPHTNVRYWDLRYFYDPRSYIRYGKNDLPIPDMVAVNGPVAKTVYLKAEYPAPQITEVEALRFLHTLYQTQVQKRARTYGASLKVLVCGDFLSDTNHRMLSWLAIAMQSLPPQTRYVLKPHPACPITLTDFPSGTLEKTHAPLAELLPNCDVVFTSNTTSAAVEAYSWGLPVVQMLAGNTLNMSPLRCLGGVSYVATPHELASALLHARHGDRMTTETFFYLDQELPRWMKLLGLRDLRTNEF